MVIMLFFKLSFTNLRSSPPLEVILCQIFFSTSNETSHSCIVDRHQIHCQRPSCWRLSIRLRQIRIHSTIRCVLVGCCWRQCCYPCVVPHAGVTAEPVRSSRTLFPKRWGRSSQPSSREKAEQRSGWH